MFKLLKMFKFIKQYSRWMLISFFLMILSTFLSLIQPKLLEWAVDFGIARQSIENTLLAAGAILLSAVFAGGFNIISGYFLIKSSQGIGFDIRNVLYRHIMSFNFMHLDKWRTGELLVRMNTDIHTLQMFLRMGLLMIIQSVLMIIGSLVIMFITNAELTWIMAVIMPATLCLFFIIAAFVRPAFMKVRERLDKINNTLQENLAGAKLVRAASRQDYEIKQFDEKNLGYLKISLKVGYIVALLFPLLFFIGQLTLTITLWAGGRLVVENILNPSRYGLTLGQLLAFNNYAGLALFPLIMLGMVLSFISMAAASAVRIDDILKEQPEKETGSHPREVDKFRGKIEFKNVSFHYGNGENAVDNINLVIQPCEKIGILGRTGSGKSSLVYLIPALYTPQTGEILIDDINTCEISFASLRSKTAFVLQETVLFNSTIKDNILFGKPSAGAEELERAARIACAYDFIMEAEHQWDEPVGERGMGLSGGQRQRIAIARAVISAPDILILDDVTSSVDLATERALVENLYRELPGTTTIILSQKINTLRRADRILVMEEGKITGTGSHEQLLGSNAVYREIYETQNAEFKV